MEYTKFIESNQEEDSNCKQRVKVAVYKKGSFSGEMQVYLHIPK